ARPTRTRRGALQFPPSLSLDVTQLSCAVRPPQVASTRKRTSRCDIAPHPALAIASKTRVTALNARATLSPLRGARVPLRGLPRAVPAVVAHRRPQYSRGPH